MSASASGRYHNNFFKKEAANIGVICDHDNSYGYQIVDIMPEIKQECFTIITRYYADIENCLQLYYMVQKIKSEGSPCTNPGYVTYQCPICKKKIKASANSCVICGIDGVPYERI